MLVNKIYIDENTSIDLTKDTVEPDDMLVGTVAHNSKGETIVGTLPNSSTLHYTEEVNAGGGITLSIGGE